MACTGATPDDRLSVRATLAGVLARVDASVAGAPCERLIRSCFIAIPPWRDTRVTADAYPPTSHGAMQPVNPGPSLRRLRLGEERPARVNEFESRETTEQRLSRTGRDQRSTDSVVFVRAVIVLLDGAMLARHVALRQLRSALYSSLGDGSDCEDRGLDGLVHPDRRWRRTGTRGEHRPRRRRFTPARPHRPWEGAVRAPVARDAVAGNAGQTCSSVRRRAAEAASYAACVL